MCPGSHLRQTRERLGLTYREVERASYEVAARRGSSEFIVRISRLADIENREVIPSLHKLYSLATIYHLDPREICRWYEVPLEEHFRDGARLVAPRTHLAAPPMVLKLPLRFDPGFDPKRTALLTRLVESWGHLEASLINGQKRYQYAFVGLEDRWMEPLVRPGSLLLVDPQVREVYMSRWRNEYERPIYLVEMREGYRCSWCVREGERLVLQPHPLAAYAAEVRKCPQEAEVVGQVVGVTMRLIPN